MALIHSGLTEPNYRHLFDNASDAMWLHDMDGNFVDANKAFARLSGYAPDELIGLNAVRLLSGESLAKAREIRRRLLQGEELEQPYEQHLITKQGIVRIVKMSTSPVIMDGEVRGFQHVARDVTEEKKVEEMLAKITDGSPIAAFVINREHKVTHWNTAIQSLTGISAREIIGTDQQWRSFYAQKRPTMADLIVDGASPEEIGEAYQGQQRKSRLIEGAYEAESYFPDLGESGKWLQFTASPIRDERGSIIGAIETLHDITEEKKLQDDMHFYTQLVTRAQEDERKRIARELHDDVSSSLLLLIQRLDMISKGGARPLAGKMAEDIRAQAVAALESLRRCAQDLRPRILDDLGLIPALEWMLEGIEKDCGIKAKMAVSGERTLPTEVQLLVFRIVQEALNNIRKHAGASRVSVNLDFVEGELLLRVADNGRGFAMPERVENLASSGHLGVMGMYERARLLGGTLEVRSKPGKGTRVTARIPC